MNEPRVLPAFSSEEEEANWWYDNREKHATEFAKAYDAGHVQRGTLARRVAMARGAQMLTLNADDLAKARSLAQQRGMEIASYLDALLHEALEREMKLAG